MKIVAIIPARMQSSRFPGKPLADIHGLPMIEHVRRRVLLAKKVDEVFIATCDIEIKNAIEKYGGKVIMTKPDHLGGTDRVAEAASKITADIIINVQGDEPLVRPEMIDRMIEPFEHDSNIQCTHLMSSFKNEIDFFDYGNVKVVTNNDNYALYFSREPIPASRKNDRDAKRQKVIGIYAFTKDTLQQHASSGPQELEQKESIDMLRLLEIGIPIKMVLADDGPMVGVDNYRDLIRATEFMSKDPVFPKYMK